MTRYNIRLGFRVFPVITSILILLGLTACQSAPVPGAKAAEERTAKPPADGWKLAIPADRNVDDLARFLAGLPGQAGSAFKDAEQEASWVAHAAQSDQGWKRFLSQRQPLMRDFAKAKLSGQPFEQRTLFYPFGGPDIMTAQTFFPSASNYVLVGLEPPGTAPAAAEVKANQATYLPGLRGSLGSILSKSFFVTKEMDQQLRGQAADGLLPVMLVELVRNGNTIRGMRYIGIGDDGRWKDRTAHSKPRGLADGVAVEFADAGGVIHTLSYFSLNLADEKLKDNQPFLRFVGQLAPAAAMFKSTSYMPHREEFSMIREEVLKVAEAVVQDDSGIPYHFFGSDKWKVQLYGHYDKPYGSFRYRQQKDLRDAFANREQVGELPFSIGYGFGRMKSSLIVATKKQHS